MDLKAYFDRVDFHGAEAADIGTLIALHTAHTFNIPFENLDQYAGKQISLDPDDLFDKLVSRRRGGYCFEMNILFAAVLRELGFNVWQLLARTAHDGVFGPKLHEVLLVTIEEKQYLADVGYGNDGIAAPLELVKGVNQSRFASTYNFTIDDEFGFVLNRRTFGDNYEPMYAFTLDKCLAEDFEVSNHYTATSPKSFFRMQRFATKPTPSGRITLTEQYFKISENGKTTERELGEGDFEQLLKSEFGLILE